MTVSRHPLIDNVEHVLAQLNLRDSGMVVAVSGGPDSVALLLALLDVTDAPLVIAHLNHQMRGNASDADERFVRNLHARLESARVGLRCERIDVCSHAAEAKQNVEATARRLRYAWLATIAREAGASTIATGHNADDQAETVLHRLLRGTGLRGLRGIALEREIEPGARVVRPLLTTTRAQVLSFLEERRQSTCDDATNLDLAFTRNRIRHHLLPHLAEHYNPGIRDALCRLAHQASEAYDEEARQAQALLTEAELPRAGSLVILSVDRLRSASSTCVRALLRLIWEREGWPCGEMGREQWNRAVDVAALKVTAVDFPGRIRARHRGNVLQIGPIS